MVELSSVIPYAGRTVDYLAFQGAKVGQEVLLGQSLVSDTNSGLLITGIEKLVQRFVIELLTEQGSLHYEPDRGTLFILAIRSGTVRTEADLYAQFSSAEVDIRNHLRQEEDGTEPEDERYVSASLLNVTLVGSTANLRIEIVSGAGESREFIFPLPVAIS